MAYNKKVLLLLLAAVATVKSQNFENNLMDTSSLEPLDPLENLVTSDPLDPFDEGNVEVPQDFLISWQARRSIRKILAQMPCGWPEYGIPPLAPYINENLTLNYKNSVLKTENNFKPIRIDGLNNMEIQRLKIGIIFKRIHFDFNFPNITFTGNFDTSTILNLKDIIGARLIAIGGGKLSLSLQNLRIIGKLKYKLPIIFGSAKITQLNAQLSLGNVESELSGFINGLPIGGRLNDLIMTNLLKYLNQHDYIWNGLIEKYVLPVINTQLEGKTLWKIFWWSITTRNSNENTCGTAGELNNMDILELHQLLLKS